MSLAGGLVAGGLAVIALDAAVQNAGQATSALGMLPKMAAWLIDPATPGIPNLAGYVAPPAIPTTVPAGAGDAQCPAGYSFDPKTNKCVSNLKPGSPGTKKLA